MTATGSSLTENSSATAADTRVDVQVNEIFISYCRRDRVFVRTLDG